jgi:hypothetical protein
MRRAATLRDILRQTLARAPVALTLLGAASCRNQPAGICGAQIVVVNGVAKPADGGFDCSACADLAGYYDSVLGCNPVTVNTAASVACEVQQRCFTTGRRPASLVDAHPAGAPGTVGALFAEAARLELASVVAFRILAIELEAHRAPPTLVSRARRAAAEEVTHARLTSALAERHGARPALPLFSAIGEVRTLDDLALENAMEGCIRESFGVAVALHQARHACDSGVADAMSVISRDELGHAELGWAIAEWAESKLGRGRAAFLREARAAAAASLLDEPAPPTREQERVAGLPSAERYADLATRFRKAIELSA